MSRTDRRADRGQVGRPVHTCLDCGRATYLTRRDAKSAMQRLYPGKTLAVVICGEGYHLTSKSPSQIGIPA